MTVDAGFVALLVFVAVLVMLGFCLARVRGLSREIDLLRDSLGGTKQVPKTDATQDAIASVLGNDAILRALGGASDE